MDTTKNKSQFWENEVTRLYALQDELNLKILKYKPVLEKEIKGKVIESTLYFWAGDDARVSVLIFTDKTAAFIVDGKYRNKATNGSNPQFYRFDKPEDDNFPKMIELFCRSDFKLKDAKGITPIHIDDEVSSLSAILLNDDYYKALLNGKEVRKGLSVLRPEYIILFKAKAYLDLKRQKDLGEKVDSSDIKKHKKDVLRIASELMLEKVEELPIAVDDDIHSFIDLLEQEPFDQNSLKIFGLKNEDVVEVLKQVFG